MNTTQKSMVLATALGSPARAGYKSISAARAIRPATGQFRMPEIVPSNLGPLPLAAPDEEFERRRANEIRRLIEHDKLIYGHEMSMA